VSAPGRRAHAAAGLLALTLICGVTACTSSPRTSSRASSGTSSGPTSARSATGTVPATPPPSFAGTAHRLPSGTALANDPDLYKTVALTSCTRTADGWAGHGTATNPTGTAIDYAIVVLFTDAQARDIDSASVSITVPARHQGTWTATRAFAAPTGTRCVVRAVHPAAPTH
jgi:hypothetical protein